jgi:hypothetical protein
MTTSDNPMAFPSGLPVGQQQMQEGMTLRDYFAGQALAGAMAGSTGLGSMEKHERIALFLQVAEAIYEIADAMLAVRQEPTS